MRIFLFTHNFPPESNACSVRAFEHAKIWSTEDDVIVFTAFPNFPEGVIYQGYKNRLISNEMYKNVHVVRTLSFPVKNSGLILRTCSFVFQAMSTLTGALFQRKADVVIGSSPQFFIAIAAFLYARIKKSYFVFEVRDLWPQAIVEVGALKKGILVKQLEKIERFLYRRADKIVVVSNSFKQKIIEKGIPEEKINVIFNGANLDKFKPMTKAETLMKQHRLNGKFIVGYIGTMGMAHNLNSILDIASLLIEDKNICFLFVGEGAEKQSLIERAEREGLDNVVFLSKVNYEQIEQYWSLLDITIISWKDEKVFSLMLPAKMFESIAMGKPIILSAPTGEAASLMNDNGLGIHVLPGDSRSLLYSIRKMREGSVREVYANQCLKGAIRFSRQNLALEMQDALKSMVTKHD